MIAMLVLLAAWTEVASKNGVTIEKRAVEGSPYPELRLQAKSKLSPEQLCAAAWAEKQGKYEKMMKVRRSILETPTERIYYQQIATPVIADRDYTVHLRLLIDRATHVCQMIYAADNARGPPPQKGIVRIEKMSGGWTFEPAEGGGTLVTYLTHSDPAGALPAFLARGAQIDAARDVWSELEAYATAHPGLTLP